MNCNVRALKPDEYKLLNEFLYEAIFIHEGESTPDKSIINQPDFQVYTKDFGKSDDYALVAEYDGKIVGCIWSRIMDDYGHIDDETPSLAISFYPEYRGKGMGTKLMGQMLSLLKEKGYRKLSLSVQKANYAYSMYRKFGFRTVSENSEELIMICDFQDMN